LSAALVDTTSREPALLSEQGGALQHEEASHCCVSQPEVKTILSRRRSSDPDDKKPEALAKLKSILVIPDRLKDPMADECRNGTA
jgi:hypothetical protein